jgi:hypothetical protein
MEPQLNTVGYHIDLLRESIKESSDDTDIYDLVIYAAMVDVRALLIDQDLTKRKEVDEMYYQTICLDLCVDDYAKCCKTYDINKKILRSRNALPDYITHKFLESLMVTSIDGETNIPRQKTITRKWDKYWDSKFHGYVYDVTNFNDRRTLIVYGTLDLPTVLVTGVFLDPSGAVLVQSCDEDTTKCPDWKDVLFPIPSKLREAFWDMCRERLTMTLKYPTDTTNDAQSSTEQK